MLRRLFRLLCVLGVMLALDFATQDDAQAQSVDPAEAEAAIRYHFPAGVEDAMIVVAECESGLGQDIYNEWGGAHGLFQEMPETADAYGHDYSALADPWYSAEAAYDLWADGGYAPWAASSWCHGYY